MPFHTIHNCTAFRCVIGYLCDTKTTNISPESTHSSSECHAIFDWTLKWCVQKRMCWCCFNHNIPATIFPITSNDWNAAISRFFFICVCDDDDDNDAAVWFSVLLPSPHRAFILAFFRANTFVRIAYIWLSDLFTNCSTQTHIRERNADKWKWKGPANARCTCVGSDSFNKMSCSTKYMDLKYILPIENGWNE